MTASVHDKVFPRPYDDNDLLLAELDKTDLCHQFSVGDTVRLTSKFLKNTGQRRGGEGCSTWTVLGFNRISGWVIVNEEVIEDYYPTPEELAVDPTLKFRRIAAVHLYRVGTQTSRNSP